MSDFIAPKETGVKDYIGMFANGIFGVEALMEQYKAELDDYRPIMVEALTDRLAEQCRKRCMRMCGLTTGATCKVRRSCLRKISFSISFNPFIKKVSSLLIQQSESAKLPSPC